MILVSALFEKNNRETRAFAQLHVYDIFLAADNFIKNIDKHL